MSNPIKQRVVKTTTTDYHLTLDKKSIIKMLDNTGITIPPNAVITFHVPGGGDWSNSVIDVDEEHPIHVSWSTTETHDVK